MHLWKAAATKLRAVNGMRGFKERIKGKTKLLRRDSKDSTEEEAVAARPAKSARKSAGDTSAGGGTSPRSASGGGGGGGVLGGGGSWGRASKRQSLLGGGKDASRSEQSLATTVDTIEPQTPTTAAILTTATPSTLENGDVVMIEGPGATATKKQSEEVSRGDVSSSSLLLSSTTTTGGVEAAQVHVAATSSQPQLVSITAATSPLANPPTLPPPDLSPTLTSNQPTTTTTTRTTTPTVTIPATGHRCSETPSPKSAVPLPVGSGPPTDIPDIPVVRIQRENSDLTSAGALGSDVQPSQQPQSSSNHNIPLAENENENLQPQVNNTTSSTITTHTTGTNAESKPSSPPIPGVSAPASDTTPVVPSPPITSEEPAAGPTETSRNPTPLGRTTSVTFKTPSVYSDTSSVSSAPVSRSNSAATVISRSSSKRVPPSVDLPNLNTTNLPSARNYRVVPYPADQNGSRTDNDGNQSQLRQSSSRTSLNGDFSAGPEQFDVVPERHERRSTGSINTKTQPAYSTFERFPSVHSTFSRSNSTAQPPNSLNLGAGDGDVTQTLGTVSESSPFNANSSSQLDRNDSLKSLNYHKLITSGGSRRKILASFARRQSLIHPANADLLQSLLEQDSHSPTTNPNIQYQYVPMPQQEVRPRTRKVWVKRPGGSPTQVIVAEDDFVDTVRDLCLRKYSNALGRQYDSPDLMIKILPAQGSQSGRSRAGINTGPSHSERILQPDDLLCQVLDDYYPTGQTSEDALIVEVPQQQHSGTPKPSPGLTAPFHDIQLPIGDYFPPVSTMTQLSHSQPGTVRSAHPQAPNPGSLQGYLPSSPLPASPGHRNMKRPKPGRNATGSPVGSTTGSVQGSVGGVVMVGRGGPERSRSNIENPVSPAVQPQLVALPSSPGIVKPTHEKPESPGAIAHVTSPGPKPAPPKSKETVPTSIGTLDGQVPAINVLIVEDNIINLKLLEAFMKRLKVRWQTAMNGRDAVSKWRTGAFQLVLMDIQLPVMNGLDATKEIRRLERINGIGSLSSTPAEQEENLATVDKLDKSLVFKGSVIIVALTASSLQSDRHEALAVGCNDFLTKPVNFTFLERKVMEWGCMQALIDFEGWRKWKDLAIKPATTGSKTINKGRVAAAARAAAVANAAKEKEKAAAAAAAAAASALASGMPTVSENTNGGTPSSSSPPPAQS